MPFFVFNSKIPIKGRVGNFYKNLKFSESDLLLDSQVRGFATSLFYSYLEFLLFKLKSFFKKTGPITLNRKSYCINKYFKHVLVVEWGFYDNRIFYLSPEVFHSCDELSFYRPYSIPEYECSERDLKNPFHKTNYHRFCGSSHYQPPYEELTPHFFFNFFVLIPVSISGFVNMHSFDAEIREFNPPMKLNFPILFELFLLKFDVFSFLLSSSLSSIYEFFSLGYLKSIAIYFRNILFLIKKYYFNSIFNYDGFTDDDICLLKLKSSFSNLLNFYSLKHFNSKYYLSSNFYKNMLKESEFYILDGKLKIFNFIFKNFIFFIFLCYVYDCFFLNSVEILYGFNLFFSWRLFIIYFLLFTFLIFYIFRRYFMPLSTFDFRLSFLIQSFFSSFLHIFVGLISYIFLLKILYSYAFDTAFLSLFIATFFFFLFSFLTKSVALLAYSINRFFFNQKIKVKLLFSDFSSPPLVTFLPILVFPFLFFFKLLLDNILLLCIVSELYMPDVTFKELPRKSFVLYNTFTNSDFKVPFYDIDWDVQYNANYFWSYDADPEKLQLKKEKIDSKVFKIPIDLIINYNCSYYFKFLVDSTQALFEVQYNHFDGKKKPFFGTTYRSYSVNKFPNKFIFFMMIINMFVIFFFINIIQLVFYNLNLCEQSCHFVRTNLNYYSNFSRFLNSNYTKRNLSWTTYKIFDLFFLTFGDMIETNLKLAEDAGVIEGTLNL